MEVMLTNDTNASNKVNDIRCIAKGTIHQGEKQFGESAGKQCVANSITSLIYSTIVHPQYWSQSDIDTILQNGNRLYNLINSDHDYLLVNEIPSDIYSYGSTFNVTHDDGSYGILDLNSSSGNSNDPYVSIYTALNLMSESDRVVYAVLCIQGYSVALLIENENVYVFDPHSRNEQGQQVETGMAVLLHCKSISDFCTYIIMAWGSVDFELTQVYICHKENSNGTVPKSMISSKHCHNQEQTTSNNCLGNKITSCKSISTGTYLASNDALMERYMNDQHKRQHMFKQTKREKLKLKKIQNQKKIANKRKGLEFRNKEKLQQAEYKRKQRQNPDFKERELLQNCKAMKQRRSDTEYYAKEVISNRDSMKRRRTDTEYYSKENIANRKAMKQKRSDTMYHSKEVIINRESMKTRRSNTEYNSKEKIANREAMKQRRLDKDYRSKEKITNCGAMKQRRSDKEYYTKEKRTNCEAIKQRRSDKEYYIKEKRTNCEAIKQRRSDKEYYTKEKRNNCEAIKKRRLDTEYYSQEKRTNCEAIKQLRLNTEYYSKEILINRKSMKKRRSDAEYHSKENTANCQAMKCRRLDSEYHSKEKMVNCKSMKRRRLDVDYHSKEKIANVEAKKSNRQNTDTYQKEQRSNEERKFGKTLDDCLHIFNRNIAEGPIYICTVCMQTWFRTSVSKFSSINYSKNELIEKCRLNIISAHETEWICQTCKNSVNNLRIPKLSVFNKMGFPKQPEELKLHSLEERLIAPRIPFMQIRDLPCGGQKLVHGNIVNIPIDIGPIVNILPRSITDTETIAIKFKRKLQYKKCEFRENIRPLAVWKAAKYLMQNSLLYKELNIQIDYTWLQNVQNINPDHLEFFSEPNMSLHHKSNVESSNKESNIKNYCIDRKLDPQNDSDSEDEDPNNASGGIIDMDTMLDEPQLVPNKLHPQEMSEPVTFAPGEGQMPLSIFNDKNAEYLSFPTLFCGEKRPENSERSVPVHYSDICKYELRSADRRCAAHIPNLFFKLKKIQMKQVLDKVSLALRRYRTKGKKYLVKDVLNIEQRSQMVNLDEGFYIFRTIRNSPPYLEKRKKDAFAMIRQLGFPSLFISQSAAEMRWPELLRALGQLIDHKTYTDEEINAMDWQTKSRLIKSDPVTVARYFDHRFQQFFKLVLKSIHKPIHEITDFFTRIEFARRGTVHIHWFAYIKDAPEYGKDKNEYIAKYYDTIISCSLDVPKDCVEYVHYQLHRHSKTCRTGKTNKCRFGFPIPPMSKTSILEPINFETSEEELKFKNLWKMIHKFLADFGMGSDVTMNFDQLLEELHITETEYISAIRTSIIRPKLFLKRKPCEIRVNNYMKNCLDFWRANHDIQPCLDPYAMIQYILSYVTKSQKGMSAIMSRACSEAKQGNMDLKASVRHIGNAFLNGVETSSQEAAYLVLQLPITRMSRQVVFINTSPPHERTFLLKDYDTLKQMDPESDDIQTRGLINEYEKRPKALERYCLADFVSALNITYPKKDILDDPFEDNYDDDPLEPDIQHGIDKDQVILKLSNDIIVKQRSNPRIIRFVNYNVRSDPENHYRERLMLYLPWRDEQADLLGDFETYHEHFRKKEYLIRNTRNCYEKHLTDLTTAIDEVNMEDGKGSDDPDETLENEDSPVHENDDYGFYDPDRCQKHRQYDLGNELGYSNTVESDIQHNISETEYSSLMQSLNIQQSELCTHIMQWINIQSDPMHIFIEGGAGVGKTKLVKALYHSMMKYYGSQPGEDPEKTYVLLLAPTGIAAYHIKGSTIHSALHISNKDLLPLGNSDLNTLRAKFASLKVVFIDEISMTGRKLFNNVEQRLRQILGTSKPFGGIHIIAVGDFFQMAPVKDAYIFKEDDQGYGPLAVNLWNEFFHMYSLTEIMRQKDEKNFCELLNRLRLGEMTENDNLMIQSRIINKVSPEYYTNARHFMPLVANVQKHNDYVYTNIDTHKVVVKAHHIVLGNTSHDTKVKCLALVQNMSKYSETSGLQRELCLAVGLVYAVSVNISTEDGLINGGTCLLKKIHFFSKKGNIDNMPSIIWVLFDNEQIGKLWRQKYAKCYEPDIERSWTPIFAIQRQFAVQSGIIIRSQFPLKLAAASTIHSGQGTTLQQCVIDMDISDSKLSKYENLAKLFLQHAHYVATSRVTSLKGLQIINWNGQLISVNTNVKEHMAYMHSQRKLELSFTPVYHMKNDLKCIFLNSRSLHKHFADVSKNYCILSSDVCIFAETRLQLSDSDQHYLINGFQKPFRNDALTTHNNRPSHGLISYVRQSISILEQKKYSYSTFEAILLCISCNQVPIQIVGIYLSPKCKYSYFIQKLDQIMNSLDLVYKTVLFGDFNMKSITGLSVNYNDKIEKDIKEKYNLHQIVQENTTKHQSNLDLCFTNCIAVASIIWNYWSDHNIVAVGL